MHSALNEQCAAVFFAFGDVDRSKFFDVRAQDCACAEVEHGRVFFPSLKIAVIDQNIDFPFFTDDFLHYGKIKVSVGFYAYGLYDFDAQAVFVRFRHKNLSAFDGFCICVHSVTQSVLECTIYTFVLGFQLIMP